MDWNEFPIDRIGLSVRASNVLHRAGKHTVGDMMTCTEEELLSLHNVGKLTVAQILGKIAELRSAMEAGTLPPSPAPIGPAGSAGQPGTEQQKAALDAAGFTLEALDLLTVRAYNLMNTNGYRSLSSVLFLSREELLVIPGMDAECAEDVLRVSAAWLRDHAEFFKEETTPREQSIYELIRLPENREPALTYARTFDCDLDSLGLCNRAKNRLKTVGKTHLSDILLMTPEELYALPSMGKGSVDDVLERRCAWLDRNETRLRALLAGDEQALLPPPLTDAELRTRILDLYLDATDHGLSLKDLTDRLPQQSTQEQIKRCVGALLASGELEYVDFRCYRVYPRFAEMVRICRKLSDRNREIMLARLEGKTLEEVGARFDKTRERVRQIVKRSAEIVRADLLQNAGITRFDEDYYLYFYQTYNIDKHAARDWLGLSASVMQYLEITAGRSGTKDLSEAQEDPALDVGLRQRIRNYLNRDKVFVDGQWIPKRQGELVELVAVRSCKDDSTLEELRRAYGAFLLEHDLEHDPELALDEEKLRFLEHRLRNSRRLLWTPGSRLRAYDVDGRDYTELFDALRLADWENTELSTLKFVEEYPELMERYDIRDQYELHNLLRKIVPEGSFHDFHASRTPIIRFGTFDRDAAIFDMMVANAPIAQSDLIQLLHEEYGYDSNSILFNMLQPIDEYYHNGKYRIDAKAMTHEHMQTLLAALTEDFYYLDELRSIYVRAVPGGDPEEINYYNLKQMGFQILSRYALRNYDNLSNYFRALLTREDLTDLTDLRRRFGYVVTFSQVLMDLRRDLEVIEYEPNKLISFRKLAAAGITRADLDDYCDAVYEATEDGVFFTAQSLRKSGFRTELYDLGFSDWFYASLLISDPRFSYGLAFKNIVLCRGKRQVTIREFGTELIRVAGSIDVYDLQRELEETYGCTVADRLDLIHKVSGGSVYHDRHLDRLYDSEEHYWRDVDEAEDRI